MQNAVSVLFGGISSNKLKGVGVKHAAFGNGFLMQNCIPNISLISTCQSEKLIE